ncbi:MULTISPECIES: HAD family hydrolase [Prauserella salsuginis group]|uniref:HAD family hydrolase n=1 Tax=Prauserella salsuginis TaxID=387889 RepID=A0ABW6G8Y1_9PSEU|nr:putative hydrolase of the HAD superfamily [Prauserella flava]MCR3735582.1 putative hydrolase of the HAD superfamily [Prauserella salsuginis]
MAFALGSPTAPHSVADTDRDDVDVWAPPELRAVCLDIDDTLIDFTATGKRTLATLTGRADIWDEWERVTDEHVARVVAGELDYADMHARRSHAFLRGLGMDVDLADAAVFETRRKALLNRSWRLFDDVVPCLEWLAAAGVQLAAVTNASGAHQRDKLAALGLARFFDHVAIAGELGVAKPDPAMFQSVCLQLGCDPREAVHLGDKLTTDAIGARDAGLTGIWLHRDPDGAAGSGAEVSADTDDAVRGAAPADVPVLTTLAALPELLVSEFVRVGVPAPR